MEVNSLLAAKNFNVKQDNIVVGNGAAELIKALMGYLSGKVGFIKPTFEEYSNRYDETNAVIFMSQKKNFIYTAQDLIDFYDKSDISNLVIVNPDNPSGNYIPKKEIINLLKWAKQKEINLIIDESFVDFADEENASIIEQTILDDNPNLFVMKSISKSYGVPGLRLGILASGNKKAIEELKQDVAIWNINSFAEFYMQIEEKYRKDYIEGLRKYRQERERIQKQLENLSGISIASSQANYIMVELLGDITATELTERLLLKHKILVKDLSGKIRSGKYIRIAIRNEEDNNRLLSALQEELML